MAALHKGAFPYTAKHAPEAIEVRPLDEVLEGTQLDEHILVKIDVQGYEDNVILGGTKIIKRAKVLIVEVSFDVLYEGQCLFDDIYHLVRKMGFRYAGQIDQLTSPVDGTLLQADALFLRGDV